jgi:ABC-type microcin C transport system duplicated ATPase subunit YejF
MRNDGRLTVRIIAEELTINTEIALLLLTTNLGIKKSCAKMVLMNDTTNINGGGKFALIFATNQKE